MTTPTDLQLAAQASADLRARGEVAEAAALMRVVLDQDPAAPEAQYEFALALLMQGRYADAWPLYEARLQLKRPPALPFQRWRGHSLSGRRLLVVGEPDLRDQVLFARYIPALVEAAAEVTFLCHPALTAAAGGLGAQVLAMTGEVAFPDPDFWIMSGSVPYLLGAKADPPPPPYLIAAEPPPGLLAPHLAGAMGLPANVRRADDPHWCWAQAPAWYPSVTVS